MFHLDGDQICLPPYRKDTCYILHIEESSLLPERTLRDITSLSTPLGGAYSFKRTSGPVILTMNKDLEVSETLWSTCNILYFPCNPKSMVSTVMHDLIEAVRPDMFHALKYTFPRLSKQVRTFKTKNAALRQALVQLEFASKGKDMNTNLGKAFITVEPFVTDYEATRAKALEEQRKVRKAFKMIQSGPLVSVSDDISRLFACAQCMATISPLYAFNLLHLRSLIRLEKSKISGKNNKKLVLVRGKQAHQRVKCSIFIYGVDTVNGQPNSHHTCNNTKQLSKAYGDSANLKAIRRQHVENSLKLLVEHILQDILRTFQPRDRATFCFLYAVMREKDGAKLKEKVGVFLLIRRCVFERILRYFSSLIFILPSPFRLSSRSSCTASF